MLRRRERLPNPGRTEELKKEAQGIMTLDVFDGEPQVPAELMAMENVISLTL